jgi:integrase
MTQTTEDVQRQNALEVIPSSMILEVKNGKAKLQLTQSATGHKLRQPIEAWIPFNLNKGQQALYRKIWESLSCFMPRLIPIAYENESLMKLAKFFSRNNSGSENTINQYIYLVSKYCDWIGTTPDKLIENCFKDGKTNTEAVYRENERLDDYVGDLQARDLAPKTVRDHVKAIKAFFMVHRIAVALPYHLSGRKVSHDRAPKPDELQKLLDVADSLRDRVVVSMLALGGFREGTLVKLQYRHVKHDLERNIMPVHIHVEAEITKGKYGDYDTFLGPEAVNLLKAYLELRRRGSPSGKIPPETIADDSPLIRSSQGRKPKAIAEKQIYNIVHNLYFKADLLEKPSRANRYSLCAHSIRKFFRTQLTALGVPSEYTEYMMGHKQSTYHDIQMKGIEFLRNIYAASGLSIKPKTTTSKIDTLKEIIRAWGMNPEELLTKKALTQPYRTVIAPGYEENQVQTLSNALKEMMRKELLLAQNGKE